MKYRITYEEDDNTKENIEASVDEVYLEENRVAADAERRVDGGAIIVEAEID